MRLSSPSDYIIEITFKGRITNRCESWSAYAGREHCLPCSRGREWWLLVNCQEMRNVLHDVLLSYQWNTYRAWRYCLQYNWKMSKVQLKCAAYCCQMRVADSTSKHSLLSLHLWRLLVSGSRISILHAKNSSIEAMWNKLTQAAAPMASNIWKH